MEMLTGSAENQFLFNRATDCLQENKSEEAIELFNQLLKKEPNNIHALNGKGSGLMQLGRLDEAEDVFNESLNIEDNPMAYLNLTIIYGNTQRYNEALKYCDLILELYPDFSDVVKGLKNNYMDKKSDNGLDGINPEARKLIEKANALKENNETWSGGKLHDEFIQGSPEFKRITFWDAWELYENAIEIDSECENIVTSYIIELKNRFMQEFLFFDISRNDDFSPDSKTDKLKLTVMKEILLDHDFTQAQLATRELLTIDENDPDAIDYHGVLFFYFDEIDESIRCFDRLIETGDGIYSFYGKYNKAFALRRKSMITGDLEYMVQTLDIYDEMLKDPNTFDRVKPYQREILDKLQDFMKIPLF